MPSLSGAITVLGLGGLSVGAPFYDSEYQTVPRPFTQQFTQLGPGGLSTFPHSNFTGKTEETTAALSVSDTASLSATESPVDSNEIATSDTVRLSLTESSQLFNFQAVTDTASLSLSETISLVQSGVTLKTASDTASLSVTEVSSIAVSVAITDTASLTLTESASVAVSTEQVTVSDTASLTIDESVLLNVFAGVNAISVADSALLSVIDTASVTEVRRIKRIGLSISRPYIELEIL